ncbi:SH3 domain-containing protein [Bdellovibrio sp. SKB1291214]|uniref:SH3 domain-containing protein n=1 Tax=Bdellovibrio sp. SKB1291214 TaxID=1732569 RepID=UPI0020CFCE1C|nr:SH3 domain-containing protein [Bdellovibrio sp. SKB1291214]UYL07999.1 SH3 domain-containing protein [Bdellovibrio sp. SKB1291214]
MHSIILSVLPIFFAASSAYAALATDASAAISFYRTKESPFSSGQASRTILESRLISTQIESTYRVRWDRREYELEAKQILKDIQVAKLVDTNSACQLLSLNRNDSGAIKVLNAGATVEILETDDYWARVRTYKDKVTGWVPLSMLKNRHDDVGVFVNIMDTYLRGEAHSFAKVITTVPRLSRVQPLGFEKGFMKISFNNMVGFVDVNHFASRADFSNLAFVDNKWIPITHRNGEYLVSAQRAQIPLQRSLGYVTSSTRGVVIRATPGGPQLLSRVEITKPEANIWALSKVDGHGEVWWKRNSVSHEITPVADKNTITTDELMKREIYSIAFENKSSVRGIVSAEGIYTTEDGLTWKQIPQFGKQNYPVYIHPKGQWFVGSYKSTNLGQSFEPFIRWEIVADAIEASIHRNPKLLRLTQIEAVSPTQIIINVDTGSSKIKLMSSLSDSTHWTVLKK